MCTLVVRDKTDFSHNVQYGVRSHWRGEADVLDDGAERVIKSVTEFLISRRNQITPHICKKIGVIYVCVSQKRLPLHVEDH